MSRDKSINWTCYLCHISLFGISRASRFRHEATCSPFLCYAVCAQLHNSIFFVLMTTGITHVIEISVTQFIVLHLEHFEMKTMGRFLKEVWLNGWDGTEWMERGSRGEEMDQASRKGGWQWIFRPLSAWKWVKRPLTVHSNSLESAWNSSGI